MTFLFFNVAGSILFERSDAESASVVHEEMSLQALFPYVAAKSIERGMRVGYRDALDVFQVYEIRKVKTYEPDHYQELTAEHICISELTDEFFGDAEWTDISAPEALGEILENTLWDVGNVSTTIDDTLAAYSETQNHNTVGATMQAVFGAGNVNLLTRPQVPAADLTAAGWEDAGEGTATVFSVMYSAGKTNDYDYEYSQNIIIHLTPILASGSVKSPQQLEDYVDGLLEQTTIAGILNADKTTNGGYGLILWIQPVASSLDNAFAVGDDFDVWLHDLQAAYYLDDYEEMPTADELSQMYTIVFPGDYSVSSANITMSNVWADVRTIERNWNCHIIPRVIVDSTGITARYLDITTADGTWRGMRLSLDKNADEMGVTWDDSRVKTALYAFGKSVEQTIDGEKVTKPITFTDVVWSETADHPAKPAGQAYLEDPDATAAYGRNGRPRFAYYQNGDISDPEILLQKTWESLKTLNHPDVTIDCLVCDLYRLGYNDVPLRLYDTALTEIRPTGTILHKQIVQYTEDLIDPTQSRVSIGTYIPNIIYINRETGKAAGRGGSGGGGQSNREFEDSVFKAWFDANALELDYTVAELNEVGSTVAQNVAQLNINRNNITAMVAGEGAQIGADGKVVVDANGEPIFVSGKGLYSKIEQNASAINLRVVKGDVATQLSIECGNVHVTGTAGNANLVVDGYVEADTIFSASATHKDIYANDLTVDDTLNFENLVGSGTSSIEAATIEAYSLTLNGDPITEVIVGASVSGNVLTLTKDDGTTITFSKATMVTGSWDGSGTYTATATQNGETVGSAHTTPTLQLNGNGSTSFSAQLLSDDQSLTLQKSINCYLVQSGTRVNACRNSDGTGIVGSITVPSGGGYTPADIRIGNITNESGSHSTGDGTVLNDLGSAISRAGSRTYVRFIADLNGYSGSGKVYYIPIN